MTGYPHRNFLFFITDSMNRSLYMENGIVKTSAVPVPLPQDPGGWPDMKISFGTNQNYWSLLRSYTVPMFFIGDGAAIVRHAIYSGKGYEEERYVMILKGRIDDFDGKYKWMLEYKGRIDLSKHVDEPRKGITVNTIEGGVLSYLTANEDVAYEIKLAPVNPDAKMIGFDGVTLFDRLRYSMVDQTFQGSGGFIGTRFAVNLPFISNEGDSVGILNGSQAYEDTGVSIQLYTQNSANYFLSSIRPIQIRITGTILFHVEAGAGPGNSSQVYFQFRTGPYPTFDNQYTVLGTDVGGINPDPIIYNGVQDLSVNVDVTINLAANERLFFIGFVGINGGSSHSVTINLSDLYVSFQTKNPPSTAYGITIYDLNRQLVQAMSNGRYTGDSVYYKDHTNILFTSTTAIQNFAFQVFYGAFDTQVIGASYYIKVPGVFKTLPTDNQIYITGAAQNNGAYTVLNISPLVGGFTTIQVEEPLIAATGLSGTINTIPVLKISYKDFFNDVNVLSKQKGAGIGMKIINDTIFIEPKEDLYKPDVQIFDIGEIAGLKLHYADDLLCNELEIGYRSQDYRQRNGIYEFNTTGHFKLPVNSLKKKLSLLMKSRGDCFGIEFIRSIIFDKPTTDVTGDNQSFVIDTKPGQADVVAVVSFIPGITDLLLTPAGIVFVPGDVIQISGSASNDGVYTVAAVAQSLVGQFVAIAPGSTPFTSESSVSVLIHFVSTKYVVVHRPAYTNMVGVLDNTVFNTEYSPHKLMLNWGRYLRPLLKQLDPEVIKFLSEDKNSAFSTTLDGVTVSERQDEIVANLGDPIFMNRYAEFTTPVPISFGQVMANLGTGYVKGTFYGVPIYFLPIGNMDAKPATNDAQSWKLMLAPEPLNDLATLEMLSSDGIFTSDSMGNILFTSDLNSLHFNKYNFSLPAKYRHKEMHDDWFNNRGDGYISKSTYYQKWQKTDTIFIQVITKGLSTINVEVYNSDAKLIANNPMTIIADTSVPLPYIRNDYSINLSGFAEGTYFVVLSSGGVKLRISDPLDVRAVHEDTILAEFANSTNKFNTYFTGIDPIMLRFEGFLLDWSSDSTFQNYTDEIADNELLDGIPMQTRGLRTGLIPDWLDNKINNILLLNQAMIEGTEYSRVPSSKKDKKDYPGTNLKSYLYTISRSKNAYGLTTNEVGSTDDIAVIWALDGKAWGLGDGSVIQMETTNT